jgi:hypothetical protein
MMEHVSDSKEAELEEMFGRGPGDPDVHGHYPGQEPEQSECLMCHPELAKTRYPTPAVYQKKHWSETVRNSNNYGPREFGDNDPASPEQAGW